MPNNQDKMIPVYLFMGFLEAGKTQFVQEALEDPRFSTGEDTLLLVCEEGEEEYDLSKVPQGKTTLQMIEDISELNPEHLEKLLKDCGAERVVIEYNGMWQLDALLMGMPDNWGIYQAVCIADATTFVMFNQNMRSLVVDKLNIAELVYFNRFPKGEEFQELHQIVRGVSRRTDIYYEFPDGQTVIDDIEDPLPFDTNAAHITLEDKDFALWFRDLMEDPKKYRGKKMTFKAMAYRDRSFPPKVFAVGRHIMTCCVEDIQYCWIAAEWEKPFTPDKNCWITVTGEIKLMQQASNGKLVPMIRVSEMQNAEPPEQEVATFY